MDNNIWAYALLFSVLAHNIRLTWKDRVRLRLRLRVKVRGRVPQDI